MAKVLAIEEIELSLKVMLDWRVFHKKLQLYFPTPQESRSCLSK